MASKDQDHCRLSSDEQGVASCPIHDSDAWEVLRALGAGAAPCDLRVARYNATLARDPFCSERAQLTLAKQRSPGVRQALAKRCDLTTEAAKILEGDNRIEVRRTLGSNPSTPKEILSRFAADTTGPSRSWVASNPNLPEEDIRRLANDAAPSVRRWVAINRSAPSDLLWDMAAHGSPWVRRSVAINRSAPVACLTLLAKDSVTEVRRQAALHPRTPPTARRGLAHDDDFGVRIAAITRLGEHQSKGRLGPRSPGDRAR